MEGELVTPDRSSIRQVTTQTKFSRLGIKKKSADRSVGDPPDKLYFYIRTQALTDSDLEALFPAASVTVNRTSNVSFVANFILNSSVPAALPPLTFVRE